MNHSPSFARWRWLRDQVTAHPQVALVGITIAAVVVRFLRIDAESLWLDEAFSVWAAKQSLPEMLKMASWDPHPPLHYLLLKLWMAWFGATEVAVRSLSALFGAASVWAIGQLLFALGKREAGLYAATLLSVSSINVWYSQETRSYALFFFAVTISTATLLRWMQDPSRLNIGLHVVASTVAFYTHAYAIFLFAAHIAIFLGSRLVAAPAVRASFARFGVTYGLIGLLAFPWAVLVMGAQVSQIERGYWVPKATLETVWRDYRILAGSATLLFLTLALGVWALVAAFRRGEHTHRIALLCGAAIALAFPAGAFFATVAWKPIYLLRAVVPAAAGLAILAAIGISRLHRHARIAIVGVMVVASMIPIEHQLTHNTKDDWRTAVGRVNREADPGDVVILDAGFTRPAYDFYANRTDLVVLEAPTFRADFPAWLQKHNETFSQANCVWHVRAYSDSQQLVPSHLSRERSATVNEEVWGIRLSGWERNATDLPGAPRPELAG